MKRSTLKSIVFLRRGTTDGNNFSSCGIEYARSSEHIEQRLINKDCVIQSLLSEQSRQRSQSSHCEIDDLTAKLKYDS